MIHTILATAATLLLALPANADLYPKSSSVLSINGNDYDRIISQSNYTSIIEYYSPHCIHCKNLMPTYEKVAQKLAGLAKVAAVNCEKESNRLFCDRAGIRGFPTLNIVKPGKTVGKPIVQEYSGARSVKAIVEAVTDKIPNLVEKLSEENVEKWILDSDENPLAILFTNKPRINPLLKALAIEFKGKIKFAHVQISNVEKIAETYEVRKLPTLMLVKGEKKELLRHDDVMKKDVLVEFLSQAASPNPDPAPIDKTKSASEPSSEKPKAPKASATPAVVQPLTVFEKEDDLIKECLGPKTSTCLILFRPQSADESISVLINALTQLTHKRRQQKRLGIPSIILPEANPQFKILRNKLSLVGKADIVAINGKRAWWRHLTDADFSSQSAAEDSLERWISTIQLGEGEKNKLPTDLINEGSEKVIEESKVESQEDATDLPENEDEKDSSNTKESSGEPEKPKDEEVFDKIETPEKEKDHDEL